MKAEEPCALRVFRLGERVFEVYSYKSGKSRQVFERSWAGEDDEVGGINPDGAGAEVEMDDVGELY